MIKSNEEREFEIYEYGKTVSAEGLYDFILNIQNDWPQLTTYRYNKIIKNIFKNRDITEENLQVLSRTVEWSEKEGRKHLMNELLEQKANCQYWMRDRSAIQTIEPLISHYKKIENKKKLVSLYLLQSKVYYEMGSFIKAKSTLAFARSTSSLILIDNMVGAQIDLMTGIYLCDDEQFSSSISYFTEASDTFFNEKSNDDFLLSIAYLILANILNGQFSAVKNLLKQKKVSGILQERLIVDLIAVSEAVLNVELNVYRELVHESNVIQNNIFIRKHLLSLFNELLNSAILKIIKQYKTIYISYIGESLRMNSEDVEGKLRDMILNKEILGAIDYEEGLLVRDISN